MRLAALFVIIYVAVFIAYCERAYQRFLKAVSRQPTTKLESAALPRPTPALDQECESQGTSQRRYSGS